MEIKHEPWRPNSIVADPETRRDCLPHDQLKDIARFVSTLLSYLIRSSK